MKLGGHDRQDRRDAKDALRHGVLLLGEAAALSEARGLALPETLTLFHPGERPYAMSMATDMWHQGGAASERAGTCNRIERFLGGAGVRGAELQVTQLGGLRPGYSFVTRKWPKIGYGTVVRRPMGRTADDGTPLYAGVIDPEALQEYYATFRKFTPDSIRVE